MATIMELFPLLFVLVKLSNLPSFMRYNLLLLALQKANELVSLCSKSPKFSYELFFRGVTVLKLINFPSFHPDAVYLSCKSQFINIHVLNYVIQ